MSANTTTAEEAERRGARRRATSLRPSWAWQDAAKCKGMPLTLFFGVDHERASDREAREKQAAKVCAGCPVKQECLDHAIGRNEKAGVWGALNEDERDRERRRRMRRAANAA